MLTSTASRLADRTVCDDTAANSGDAPRFGQCVQITSLSTRWQRSVWPAARCERRCLEELLLRPALPLVRVSMGGRKSPAPGGRLSPLTMRGSIESSGGLRPPARMRSVGNFPEMLIAADI